MERPTILTDDEVNRLNEIRRTHECPVVHTDTDSAATMLGTLKIRHQQRGDLLDMVDKLLAGVSGLKHNAHRFAARVDHLSAENAKLKTDNGELRCINQALRADVEGMGVAEVNLRGELHVVRVDLLDTKAKLNHALKGLAQANGRNSEARTIKLSDHARYKVEITPEYLHADFLAPAMRAISTIPAKVMNLADLVERYNEVVAAVADDSEG